MIKRQPEEATMLQILIKLWKRPYYQAELANELQRKDSYISRLLKRYREIGLVKIGSDRRTTLSWEYIEGFLSRLGFIKTEKEVLVGLMTEPEFQTKLGEKLEQKEGELTELITQLKPKGFLHDDLIMTFLLTPLIEELQGKEELASNLIYMTVAKEVISFQTSLLQHFDVLTRKGDNGDDDMVKNDDLLKKERRALGLQLKMRANNDLGKIQDIKVADNFKKIEHIYEKGKQTYQISPKAVMEFSPELL